LHPCGPRSPPGSDHDQCGVAATSLQGVQTYTQDGQRTTNFVFVDDVGNTYVGQAAIARAPANRHRTARNVNSPAVAHFYAPARADVRWR
jgi:hypothetical protein